MTTVYEANYTSGTTGESNIVRGVTYDSDSQTLRCYAKTIDEANSIYDGPEGQFVLAYYDTGSKDNLVATIVVEATEPSVTVLKASVGEILQPNGGGYDIDGLESEIVAGDDAVTGDDASPFLYKHNGQTNWSPKGDEVFAISPTDETTTKTGVPASWRAAIYWKAPDDMNVLWPFEKDWYQISWPDDAPRFVTKGRKTRFASLTPAERNKANFAMLIATKGMGSILAASFGILLDPRNNDPKVRFEGDVAEQGFDLSLDAAGNLSIVYTSRQIPTAAVFGNERIPCGPGSEVRRTLEIHVNADDFERFAQQDFTKYDDAPANRILSVQKPDNKHATAYFAIPEPFRLRFDTVPGLVADLKQRPSCRPCGHGKAAPAGPACAGIPKSREAAAPRRDSRDFRGGVC